MLEIDRDETIEYLYHKNVSREEMRETLLPQLTAEELSVYNMIMEIKSRQLLYSTLMEEYNKKKYEIENILSNIFRKLSVSTYHHLINLKTTLPNGLLYIPKGSYKKNVKKNNKKRRKSKSKRKRNKR